MLENELLALDINEALAICKNAGIEVELSHTCPPRSNPSGKERVVRFRMMSDQKGELVVAHEVVGKEV